MRRNTIRTSMMLVMTLLLPLLVLAAEETGALLIEGQLASNVTWEFLHRTLVRRRYR